MTQPLPVFLVVDIEPSMPAIILSMSMSVAMDNGRFLVSTTAQHSNSLTAFTKVATVCLLSQKTKAGIRTPDQGQKAAIHAVFSCPSKNKGGVNPLNFCSGGLYWAAARLAGPWSGCSNPIQPATPRFEPKGGGYIHNQGATAMNTSVQLAPAGNPQNNTIDQIKMLETTARLCLTDAKDGHIPYLKTLIDESLQLVQLTRPESTLHEKFNSLEFWFQSSIHESGVDLVCVQSELEELLQLVIESRQALKDKNHGGAL